MTIKDLKEKLESCPDEAQVYLWDRRENPKNGNAGGPEDISELRIFKIGDPVDKANWFPEKYGKPTSLPVKIVLVQDA